MSTEPLTPDDAAGFPQLVDLMFETLADLVPATEIDLHELAVELADTAWKWRGPTDPAPVATCLNWAMSDGTFRHGTYVCSRPRGHDGPHGMVDEARQAWAEWDDPSWSRCDLAECEQGRLKCLPCEPDEIGDWWRPVTNRAVRPESGDR